MFDNVNTELNMWNIAQTVRRTVRSFSRSHVTKMTKNGRNEAQQISLSLLKSDNMLTRSISVFEKLKIFRKIRFPRKKNMKIGPWVFELRF